MIVLTNGILKQNTLHFAKLHPIVKVSQLELDQLIQYQ